MRSPLLTPSRENDAFEPQCCVSFKAHTLKKHWELSPSATRYLRPSTENDTFESQFCVWFKAHTLKKRGKLRRWKWPYNSAPGRKMTEDSSLVDSALVWLIIGLTQTVVATLPFERSWSSCLLTRGTRCCQTSVVILVKISNFRAHEKCTPLMAHECK